MKKEDAKKAELAKSAGSAKRADDQTTMTISLPKSLKNRLKELAKKENRSTSNYLTKELVAKYCDPQSPEFLP